MTGSRIPHDPAANSTPPTDRVGLVEQHLRAVAAQSHLDPDVTAPASAQARQRQQHHVRIQQRRRTRNRFMVGSVVGLAAATAIVTTATHNWANTVSTTTVVAAAAGPAASSPAASSPAASSPSSASPTASSAATEASRVPGAGGASCLSDLFQPTWQPSIVASSNVECPPALSESAVSETFSATRGYAATVIEYKLSGPANQEVLSTDPNVVSATGQAETDITFTSYPVANYFDPIDTAGSVEGIDVSTIKLSNGFDARLSKGTNGYGAVRVAWTDGKHSYLLLTTNYKTVSGTSGPSVDDMVKMAGSVPAVS
jgi:hypothetical protein